MFVAWGLYMSIVKPLQDLKKVRGSPPPPSPHTRLTHTAQATTASDSDAGDDGKKKRKMVKTVRR